DQIAVDDQIAARDVDHDRAALEPADAFGVEKAARLIVRRRKQDQGVDLAKHVSRVSMKSSALLEIRSKLAPVAVVDRHLEPACGGSQWARDPAHAEYPEMLAEDFNPVELGRGPSGPRPAADQVDAFGRAPRGSEQQKHADLGDRLAQYVGQA